MPLSNAQWHFTSALACLVFHRCEQPVDFHGINILILPSGKGLQPVDSSCCDLDLRTCSSPLPCRFMCSDIVDNVHFPSFLGSWLCHCLLQVSCIASCHCAGYCSPYHRCVILSLHLRRHSILRHNFQVLNIRCKRKLLYQRAMVLWLSAGSKKSFIEDSYMPHCAVALTHKLLQLNLLITEKAHGLHGE